MKTLLEHIINELRLSKASTGNKLDRYKSFGDVNPGDIIYHYDSVKDNLTEFNVKMIEEPKSENECYKYYLKVTRTARPYRDGAKLDNSYLKFRTSSTYRLPIAQDEIVCSNTFNGEDPNIMMGFATTLDEIEERMKKW